MRRTSRCSTGWCATRDRWCGRWRSPRWSPSRCSCSWPARAARRRCRGRSAPSCSRCCRWGWRRCAVQGLWELMVAVRPDYGSMLDPWRPAPYRLAAVALVAAVVLLWYALLRRWVGPVALWTGVLVWLGGPRRGAGRVRARRRLPRHLARACRCRRRTAGGRHGARGSSVPSRRWEPGEWPPSCWRRPSRSSSRRWDCPPAPLRRSWPRSWRSRCCRRSSCCSRRRASSGSRPPSCRSPPWSSPRV